jgi:hypothetical protein
MKDGFSAVASGSLAYTFSPEDGGEVLGARPAALRMTRFAAIKTICELDPDDKGFTVEIDPFCRLEAIATRHTYDASAGSIVPGQICQLRLEDGRHANGFVESGSLAIAPKTTRLVLGVHVRDVDGTATSGYLRISLDGVWD